ncbi:MAG: DNA primase [Alphaproteobacteria bacterium]
MAFFPPEFLQELEDKVAISEIIGRFVTLKKKGREHGACCPFHNEKTPSFTVNDEKGFYHCFGCGAHGRALRFIQDYRKIPFPEAVEYLANQTGTQLPKTTPEAAKAYEKAKTLRDVMDLATQWFQSNLAAPENTRIVDYLTGRGLEKKTIKTFRMGYAPNRRDGLRKHLESKKISVRQMVDAGLLIVPEDSNKAPYDRFRDRVMFPIMDHRSQITAFGGRAMPGNDKMAKYLNSPETALFHKGKQLYNLNLAREHTGQKGNVLVVEGYMDVIALAQAGIHHAVAPMGTAMTEDQMRMLWRYVPRIILCFDGDKAGQKAAQRVIERALPLITPEKSIAFLTLPEKEDPDSYVSKHGAYKFIDLLENADTLSTYLWQTHTAGQDFKSPEKQAKLDHTLKKLTAQIIDPSLKESYGSHFKKKIWEEFRATTPYKKGAKAPEGRWNMLFKSPIQTPRDGDKKLLIELLTCAINHPEILGNVEEQMGLLRFSDQALDDARKRVLEAFQKNHHIDRKGLIDYLKKSGTFRGLEVFLQKDAYNNAFLSPHATIEEAQNGWNSLIKQIEKGHLTLEIQKAKSEMATGVDYEKSWEKLKALQNIEQNLIEEEDE